MSKRLVAILAVLGGLMYYGCWRFLASIGFAPLRAAFMTVAIAALLAGIALLSFPKAE